MRRPFSAALAAALLLVPMACGDDGGDDDAATADAAAGDDGTTTTADGGGTGASVDLTADGQEPEVTLAVRDSAFDPTLVRAAPGARVTVDLANDGSLEHTFTVDDADVDEVLEPGSDSQVEVALPDSGTVTFYCRFHRNSGMEGTFEVSGTSGSADEDDSTTTTEAPAVGYGY